MNAVPLQIRPAAPADFSRIESMVIESFAPITWARKLDQEFGPLNGLDWRARWSLRLGKIFQEQIVLVGEADGGLAAMSSSALERKSALAYIDLLAVERQRQRHGYGRYMLRGTIRHLEQMGAKYVNLDCLTDNDHANELYRGEGFREVARHIRWFREI